MALDLEEQEQVAELKAWWTQHGNRILAVVIAVAVAVVGWQGWRWYEHGQAAQSSVLYDTLSKAAQAGDAKALRDAAGTLVESYPRTLYASMGALPAAKVYFERNDLKNAKAQLQWGIEHPPAEEFRDLARLRPAGRSRPRWSSFPIPGRCGCCGQRTWVARTASPFFRHWSATRSTRRPGMARWHASTWPTARSAGARPSKPGFPAASAPTCAPPRWPPRRAKSSPSTSRRERCAGGRASPAKCSRRRRWATGWCWCAAPTTASLPSARTTASAAGSTSAPLPR